MAVVQDSVDERSGHHVVAKDVAPFLESFVGSEYGRRAFVTAIHELEEEDGSAVVDRQVADLIDYQQRRVREYSESAWQTAGGLGFLQRGDQIDERAVINVDSALRVSRFV